jgi:hypothetical protein
MVQASQSLVGALYHFPGSVFLHSKGLVGQGQSIGRGRPTVLSLAVLLPLTLALSLCSFLGFPNRFPNPTFAVSLVAGFIVLGLLPAQTCLPLVLCLCEGAVDQIVDGVFD